MNIQPERAYKIIQKIPERRVHVFWDHFHIDIEYKDSEGEFWKGLREYLDSRWITLRGQNGWTDPKNANFEDLCTVRRFANWETMAKVEIGRGDRIIVFDREQINAREQIFRTFGKQDWIILGSTGKLTTIDTPQCGY
jgi:hypothetical protein